MNLAILVAATAALGTLAACATYTPAPLPTAPDLAKVLPKARSATVPLEMTQVATLAVLHNPDLRAARARVGIATAQSFAAGLLPDPQLSLSTDLPTDRSPGLYTGYGLGLNLDLMSLLTRPARIAEAGETTKQARLDLLWQEIQVAARARTLCVQKLIAADKLHVLNASRAAYVGPAKAAAAALATGDLAMDQASTSLAALSNLDAAMASVRRNLTQTSHDLDALLGVVPSVDVPLAASGLPVLPSRQDVVTALAQLPARRPDLEALQAGYRSHEAALRKAVLSQFPSISLGFTRARDTSDVHTIGLGVTMTLPIFDRGRGRIAVERATRGQLRRAYQARLDQAVGQAMKLYAEMDLLEAEIGATKRAIPRLAAAKDAAVAAFGQGALPWSAYQSLEASWRTRQLGLLDLEQAYWSDAIALETVLAMPAKPAAGSEGNGQ